MRSTISSDFSVFINSVGIKEFAAYHVDLAELADYMQAEALIPMEKLYDEMEKLADDTIGAMEAVGSKGLILSVTPDIGRLGRLYKQSEDALDAMFLPKAAQTINKISKKAAAKGIKTYVRNEFWSLVRGNKIDKFMKSLDDSVGYSPDLAHLAIAAADPVEMLKKYAGRLGYVNFSDTIFKDGIGQYAQLAPEFVQEGNNQRIFCDMGYGYVDMVKAYEVLKQIGYDGWISFESKNTLDVPKGIRRLRTYIDTKLAGC
jgi:sugar phosphate isomerase/epimerase